MTTNLLKSPNLEHSESIDPLDSTSSIPVREPVRLLLIGSKPGVTSIIHSLHRFGFAEVGEWSPFMPTQNDGEVMSILTKYIVRR
jgi:hypothetical protein